MFPGELPDRYTIDYDHRKPQELSVTWYVPKVRQSVLHLQPWASDVQTLMRTACDLSLASSALRRFNPEEPINSMEDESKARTLRGKTATTFKAVMDCTVGLPAEWDEAGTVRSDDQYMEAFTVSVVPDFPDGSRLVTGTASNVSLGEDSLWRDVATQWNESFSAGSQRLAAIEMRARDLGYTQSHALSLDAFDHANQRFSDFDPLLTNWRPKNQGLADDLDARANTARHRRAKVRVPPYVAGTMTQPTATSAPTAGPSGSR
jgi:hypothetical protein